jgi:hypothetical protein
MKKKLDPAAARAAVLEVLDWVRDEEAAAAPSRQQLAAAVRGTARLLEADAPGHSVEVRVPPFAAVQCIEGPRHTRGTPPNVIECAPRGWLRLALGFVSFDEAQDGGLVDASGTRVGEVGKRLPVIGGRKL